MDVGIGSVKATLEQAGWSEPITSSIHVVRRVEWFTVDGDANLSGCDNGFYRPLHTISAVLDHDNRVIPGSLERTPAWID